MRSRLRKAVLDCLHEAKIEIVSPTFMNQRQVTNGDQFIAESKRGGALETQQTPPESMIFDKADRAEKIHSLKVEAKSLGEEIKELKTNLSKADESEQPALSAEINRRELRVELLENIINKAKENSHDWISRKLDWPAQPNLDRSRNDRVGYA